MRQLNGMRNRPQGSEPTFSVKWIVPLRQSATILRYGRCGPRVHRILGSRDFSFRAFTTQLHTSSIVTKWLLSLSLISGADPSTGVLGCVISHKFDWIELRIWGLATRKITRSAKVGRSFRVARK